jgi:hypothetical protein
MYNSEILVDIGWLRGGGIDVSIGLLSRKK